MNMPADDGRDREDTTCEEGASTRRAVTTWEAFDTCMDEDMTMDEAWKGVRAVHEGNFVMLVAYRWVMCARACSLLLDT